MEVLTIVEIVQDFSMERPLDHCLSTDDTSVSFLCYLRMVLLLDLDGIELIQSVSIHTMDEMKKDRVIFIWAKRK